MPVRSIASSCIRNTEGVLTLSLLFFILAPRVFTYMHLTAIFSFLAGLAAAASATEYQYVTHQKQDVDNHHAH